MPARSLVVAGLVAMLTASCGGTEKPASTSETGFITLEPVEYGLLDGGAFKTMTTDQALLWYVYKPAATDPSKKPLAVFFNGGPGCATSILLGFNTHDLSVDKDNNGGVRIGPSPSDWRTVANLLYIDARNTGFSYSIGTGADAFTTRNFNPYIDAGDFIRVVLRFLAAHKELQKNRVIIVGESYGGARASVMLNTLINYRRLGGSGAVYHDAALMAEIQKHLEAASGVAAGAEVAPEVVARQFGRQVLIQPYMLGSAQFDKAGELMEKPGSPPYVVASETGRTFVPCSGKQGGDCDPNDNALGFINDAGRDVYIYSEKRNWLGSREEWPVSVFLSVPDHTEFLGRDPRDETKMYADMRTGAYKKAASQQTSALLYARSAYLRTTMRHLRSLASSIDQEAEFRDVFGTLNGVDRYYIGCSNDIINAYSGKEEAHSEDSPNIGRAFLENLLYVETFITNAAYDTVVYSPAIPEALKTYGEVGGVAEGDGYLTISLKDGAFPGVKTGGESRTVLFPRYANSGHPVTTREPLKFFMDVRTWLGE